MTPPRFRSGRATVVETAADVVDVDVTPVMNMFVILIPFLVSMAVFAHLSILDFSLPPNVGTHLDPSQGTPRLRLTVVVTPGYLAVTRGAEMLDSLHAAEGVYELDSLRTVLGMRRQGGDEPDEVIVAVQDKVRFRHVVNVMDVCRASGFTRVGLSSAPSGGG